MTKNTPSIRIETYAKSNYQQLYLNDSPFHIDKLVRELSTIYATDKDMFMNYEVYKDEDLKHKGSILVNNKTNFRELIQMLIKNNFGHIFTLRNNRLHY